MLCRGKDKLGGGGGCGERQRKKGEELYREGHIQEEDGVERER